MGRGARLPGRAPGSARRCPLLLLFLQLPEASADLGRVHTQHLAAELIELQRLLLGCLGELPEEPLLGPVPGTGHAPELPSTFTAPAAAGRWR
ncbi:hypothetical protein J2Z21_008984 [Streptomyces griseochromogenes]|uniref:Uncharacterized protein n=1 Tax=Streptomyces griseochromogenes TaxID=68214 RepID=A0A1B1AZL8_9ACTN|nr:hypothetical protein [Streptomyces griseochromogenes]ANP51997.1 hypothetical protein AVL59_22635 [Streptomyces griseochromogenes]MBP2055967.1 hypothetical protein [Streptomyces griseochromogenes]